MVFARARRTALLGAVAAAAVISGGPTALPAFAAGAAPAGGGRQFTTVVTSPEVTLLPQSGGAQARSFHDVGLVVIPESDGVTGVKVAVDASSLAGLVELSLPQNCAFTDAAKVHASCTLAAVDGIAPLQLGLRTTASAAVGAKGTVAFKVTAANATEDPGDDPDTTAVTVGDGPDVAVGQLPPVLDLSSGKPVEANPSVSNLGDRDAHGVTLVLSSLTEDFKVGGSYGNCRYGADLHIFPGAPKNGVVCHFDTVVRPGETYWLGAAAPVSVAASGTDGLDGALIYGWDTADGAVASGVTGGTPGTGAALTLVASPPAARAAQAVDINYDNNLGLSGLHVVSQDDLAAVAHNVRGTVGRTLTASFGVRNAGKVPTRALPGTADVTAVMVLGLPKGVQVVSAPKNCVDDTKVGNSLKHAPAVAHARTAAGFDPATVYFCPVQHVLQPGQEADFSFSLKPTEPLRAAQGAVVAAGQVSDANEDDNLATFTVTATKAAPGNPTPKPSAPASQSAGSASASPAAGGGLAHTGGGSDTLPLAGAGAAAIVLGAGAVLLARRRRAGAGSHG
ncbi:LPXTG cell wall anchor domain-containing protein [Streptacidiphilus rugosus]|uniref:LPXTG cell wall anchor domain-containing protein n=1 Tax=Streptacidiphilus rugosus TaxID=405783 RepID=UPI00055B3A0A|nr:LPXTG cell wall anchor domain-containing protein [Streptacidiphilus rugosus]